MKIAVVALLIGIALFGLGSAAVRSSEQVLGVCVIAVGAVVFAFGVDRVKRSRARR